MVKKNTQTDIREKRITAKAVVAKLTTYLDAKTARDAMAPEWRAVDKAAGDAKAELLESLPVEDSSVLYRIEDHVIEVVPGAEPQDIKFTRRSKPRMRFVEDED